MESLRVRSPRIRSFALPALALALAVAGCAPDTKAPTVAAAGAGPDGVIEDFRMTETSSGARSWVLNSRRALVYSAEARFQVYGVKVDFFESSGKKYSTLLCDSGYVNQNTNDMRAFGHVDIRTEEGVHVEAPELQFWNLQQKITSAALVKVTDAKGSVVTGTGFDSDVKVEHYRVGKVNATLKQSDTR